VVFVEGTHLEHDLGPPRQRGREPRRELDVRDQRDLEVDRAPADPDVVRELAEEVVLRDVDHEVDLALLDQRLCGQRTRLVGPPHLDSLDPVVAENQIAALAERQGVGLILSGWGGDEAATFNGRGASRDGRVPTFGPVGQTLFATHRETRRVLGSHT